VRSLACALIAAFSLTGVATADNPLLTARGVTFRVPRAWHLTAGRINGVVDPVTVFTVTTFTLSAGATPTGICAPALQRAWRADGGYVQLTEERDGASRKRMLRRVEQRPRHFELNARGGGGLCTPPNSGEIVFQQHSRAFYVLYGFGLDASAKARAAAAALLDTMRIAPRRP